MKTKLFIALITSLAFVGLQAEDGKEKGKGGKGDPAKRAAMMFKKLDTDASGTVSEEEFAASPMAKKISESKGEEAVGKMFGRLDADSDGSLTEEEIAKMGGKGGKGDKGGKGKKGGKGDKGKKDAE